MTRSGEDGRRVSLSPLDVCDEAGAGVWLPEAWAAIEGRKPETSEPSTVTGLIEAVKLRWRDATIDRIEIAPHVFSGFTIWEDRHSEVVIRGLAIHRDQRNLGYGGEAVEWLETSSPNRRFVAAIPRQNGLAVYFWLRVGFRPFRADEDRERSHDPDFLWMLRSAPPATTAAMSDP
ncbi:MAG: hypothetical protein AB7R89_15390 [Dehalococcoidia bacterium]